MLNQPNLFPCLGQMQACELRDGGARYGGKGVLKAVANVNDVLGPMVCGMDPTKQQDLDDVSHDRVQHSINSSINCTTV